MSLKPKAASSQATDSVLPSKLLLLMSALQPVTSCPSPVRSPSMKMNLRYPEVQVLQVGLERSRPKPKGKHRTETASEAKRLE